MMRLLVCSAFAIYCGALNAASADPVKDEDKLQGTWQAIEGISNGKPIPKESLDRIKMVFAGDKLSVTPADAGGKALENTFRVDVTTKPKSMDSTRVDGGGKGKTGKAIYELDGDTLKLCVTSRLEGERPTEFEAPENSRAMVVILKRVRE